MIINSLYLKSSLIFARNESDIVERESYIAIKTPNNPGFHWGNYLIFKKAPKAGDIPVWKAIFAKEFPYYSEIRHYVFAWDELKEPETPEYLEHHLELEKSIALMTDELISPKFYNKDIFIRPLQTPDDWLKADILQTLTREPHFSYERYFEFKRNQSLSYQNLEKKGQGHRFGAFIGDEIVADLGIFFEGSTGRYQNVVTHPDYRRKGICATLVYESGKYIQEKYQVKTLVMVADPEYHAAKIYESVGFKPKEESWNLYWYKGKDN